MGKAAPHPLVTFLPPGHGQPLPMDGRPGPIIAARNQGLTAIREVPTGSMCEEMAGQGHTALTLSSEL